MDTFFDIEDRRVFLEFLGQTVKKGVLIIHAFCLMPNHIHLLTETPMGELGRWMQAVLGRHAQHLNRRHDRVGHLWQGRFKPILVEDGNYFLTCSRYIHLNPYRAKIVPCFQYYPWSSYSSFVGGRCIVDWVNTEKTLGCFGNAGEYQAFVESEAEVTNPIQNAMGGLAFGSKSFIDRIRLLLRRSSHRRAESVLRSLERATLAPDMHSIQLTVEQSFADFTQCQRRGLLMYILRSATVLRIEEIAAFVGRSPGAVTLASKRIRSRMLRDIGLAARVDEVVKEIRYPSCHPPKN